MSVVVVVGDDLDVGQTWWWKNVGAEISCEAVVGDDVFFAVEVESEEVVAEVDVEESEQLEMDVEENDAEKILALIEEKLFGLETWRHWS